MPGHYQILYFYNCLITFISGFLIKYGNNYYRYKGEYFIAGNYYIIT
jgi:hypothetical protein